MESTGVMTMTVLLAVMAQTAVATSPVSCFFDTANQTHLTDLPKEVTCTCRQEDPAGTFNLRENILSQFDAELIAWMESVSISTCETLSMNLTADDAAASRSTFGPVDVVVSDVGSVELVLRDANRFLGHLFMENVEYVETYLSGEMGSYSGLEEGPDDDNGFPLSTEELYLYIIIVLGSLLIITWTAIPIAIVCSKKGRCQRHCCCVPRRTKRVSRAESWRYESNIYVNPNHARNQQQRLRQPEQQQQQQQYSTTSALQQMLPYQLVPQSEAAAALLPQLQQQQQRLRQQQRQLSLDDKLPHHLTSSVAATDTTDSRRPLVEHVHNRQLGQEFEQLPQQQQQQLSGQRRKLSSTAMAEDEVGNQYTDSSLQFADDDVDDCSDSNDDFAGADKGDDRASNANSASYGSGNRTRTLPLNPSPKKDRKAKKKK